MALSLAIAAVLAVQTWLGGIGAPLSGPGMPGQATSGRVAQVAPSAERTATDRAAARVAADYRVRRQIRARKTRLSQTYEAQLREVDELKRDKASWRRDRLLRARMAESLATARALASVDGELRTIEARLAGRLRALVVAASAELKAGATGKRRQDVINWRRSALRELGQARKKIVLPDVDFDPLADPEELEYQAQLLRESEVELTRELALLDQRETRFTKMARLRSKRQRADEMGIFDDDRPRRGTAPGGNASGRGFEADAPAAGDSADPGAGGIGDGPTSEGGGGGAPPPADDGLGGDSLADPVVVLEDVVEAGTLDALRHAARSTDPALKARATRRARQDVQSRLEHLRKQRALIEKRAARLRRTE